MNRALVTLVILIVGGLLLWQRFAPSLNQSRVQGSVVFLEKSDTIRLQGEDALEARVGDRLRRGEVVKTGEDWAVIEYSGVKMALAERTELQLVSPGWDTGDTPSVKLIGGRILTSGPVFVITPWITASSDDQLSVVNYAWKSEVDIIPIESATATVDNSTLGTLPVSLPSIWVESDRRLFMALEPFDPSHSSEAEFYAWALDLLKEEISSDDEIQ